MALGEAKAIVDLAQQLEAILLGLETPVKPLALERHATMIAEARRIVSSTSERARADVGDVRDVRACPRFLASAVSEDQLCENCGFAKPAHGGER